MSVLATPEYVTAGSRMNWTGQFNSGSVTDWTAAFKEAILFASPYDAVASISTQLKNNFSLIVESSDNGLNWDNSSGKITLHLRTDIDRGDGETDDGLSDIGGNVSDAFNAAGFPVDSWAITSYQRQASDGSTQKVSTGTSQTDVTQTPSGTSSVSTWWDKVTGEVAAGSIGLVIGGAVVIGLLIFLAVKSEVTV